MKTPAHSKLPACKAFNVEILQLQRNPNCTKRFEADILKLCWWLTYLQSLEQYMFPIYLLDWLEAGLKGNQYPTAANFLRTTPSKLEFFTNPQASRLCVTPSKLDFSSGRLPKILLVSYVSLVFAHPGKPRPRGNRYPTAANFQRVTPSKLEFLKGTRRPGLT